MNKGIGKDFAYEVLGQKITPDRVRRVIQKASAIRWGSHLVRWRYDDVTHQGINYKRGSLIPADTWHLLKRIYIDHDWPMNTTIEQINKDAKEVIEDKETEIWVYGYYRTMPHRLQWGFFSRSSGIAVIYDEVADLIATVFKPIEGSRFFAVQPEAVQIDRKKWRI